MTDSRLGRGGRRWVLALGVGLALAPAGCNWIGPPGAEIQFPESWAFSSRARPVRARSAMVSTVDAAATRVGVAVLEEGGNAVDAAVAISFALAVVNPEAGNVGGGGFMVLRMTDGSTYALDYRERAPAGASHDMYLDEEGEPTEASLRGHLASGVPGSVMGLWEAHQRFGTVDWAQLVEPAVRLAGGFEVGAQLASSLRGASRSLGTFEATREAFLPDGDSETTPFSVVDEAGNAVAVTTTLNSLYGSKVTVAGAGFLLNNEMDDFTAKPGSPNQFGLVQGEQNAIEPGKRMLSAMTPTIVETADGELFLVLGTPGGSRIITTVFQTIVNVVDFEMSLAQAVNAPRIHHQHLPDRIVYERGGIGEAVLDSLRALGHAVEERRGTSGDIKAIMVLPDGRLAGYVDPRRGGLAAGY